MFLILIYDQLGNVYEIIMFNQFIKLQDFILFKVLYIIPLLITK